MLSNYGVLSTGFIVHENNYIVKDDYLLKAYRIILKWIMLI